MTGRTRPKTRFGVFLGQVGLSWDELVERFQLADELGFDHAWLVDHLMPTDPPHERPCFEAWTSLAALAALTRRIELGVLVSSNTFRHPSLLAKQVATVDHVSGGRLILGMGTGWYADEHRRFGVEFPAAPERVERLEEAMEVLLRLLSGAEASYDGQFYRLDGAHALPRPVRGRVPILIAAHRPRMIRLAASYADVWDTFATVRGTATDGIGSSLAERVEMFDAACRDDGREPTSIRRSTRVSAGVLVGRASYAAFVERHRAVGSTDLISGLPARTEWATVREIATELIPRLRETEASQLVAAR